MTPRGATASSWNATRENEGLPRMSEPELLAGKGWHGETAMPCACGIVIVAASSEVETVYREHVASPKHVAWRAWRETV